jgi:hypothetical protein
VRVPAEHPQFGLPVKFGQRLRYYRALRRGRVSRRIAFRWAQSDLNAARFARRGSP